MCESIRSCLTGSTYSSHAFSRSGELLWCRCLAESRRSWLDFRRIDRRQHFSLEITKHVIRRHTVENLLLKNTSSPIGWTTQSREIRISENIPGIDLAEPGEGGNATAACRLAASRHEP